MRMLRWLAVALLAAMSAAYAADLPGAWVEFAADGMLDVRAITMPGMACPKVVADGVERPSTPRGAPDDAYPVQVCVAHTGVDTRNLTVGGLPAPALPRDVKRVAIIGDTGCRLKGSFIQACNDPAQWPFATVARLAAARHPDLVIHVGDYHYRETPCPADQPGCAGSPFGDNWAVWQKDFFNPAAPLLAAAPWVLTRGNHEICSRGGHGWFRLLDPHPGVECIGMTTPYVLRIDTLNLLMLDSAEAEDEKVEPGQVAAYRAQLQTLLGNAAPHAWVVTHHPFWALNQGTGVKPGETLNATLQAAAHDLIPPAMDMVLSGHVHDFSSYEFGPARPAQLIVGDGGDVTYQLVQPVVAGIMLDGAKVRRAYATQSFGYVILHRVNDGWSAVVYSVTDAVLARCHLHGRDLGCHAATH